MTVFMIENADTPDSEKNDPLTDPVDDSNKRYGKQARM
jgi:hypothetical protein